MAEGPEKFARSITFAGGRQDDVEEFSQESPTMSEATNVRFRKNGEVEKSLPMEEVTNNESGQPVCLSTVGNSLFALQDTGSARVFKDGDADWSTITSSFIPSTNEPIQGLSPASGGINYTFQEDANYRMVAYERRYPNKVGNADPSTTLVIELYDIDNNTLVDRFTKDDRHNPQVIDPGDGVICYAVDSTGILHYYAVQSAIITANVTGITDCELNFPIGIVMDTPNRDLLRIGACEDGGMAGLFIVSGDASAAGGGRGLIMWKEEFPSYAIKVQKLDQDGQLILSTTILSGTDSGSIPLDISIDDGTCAAIYGTHSESGGVWTAQVHGHTGTCVSSPSFNARQTLHNQNGTVINGTCHMVGSVAYFAFTAVLRDADLKFPNGTDNDSYVETGQFNASTSTIFVGIYHHRVASKCRKLPNEAACTVVLEQWTAMEPKTTVETPTFIPVHLKGVTPVLLDTYGGGVYDVRSAFDVGQSRNVHLSGAEQCIHLPNLYNSGTTYKFINRVQLQPEDILNFATGSDAIYNKTTAVMYPGESRGIIYEITPASASNKLTAKPVGDNALLNNAIPISFDGAAVGELSPLDQPEILFYRVADFTNTTHMTYEQVGPDPTKVRTIQAVVGYLDANGQLHRSAPSFPLFVEGNVDATNDANALWRDIGVTVPLTCYGSTRDYFIEVYIGQGSNEPQLAGVRTVALQPTDHGNGFLTVIDSSTMGGGTGTNPTRYSETIYTAGNVLAADPWPNFTDFVVTSNRMFAIGDTNKGTIYYSKLFEENIAPEFSASLVIPLGRNRTLQAIGKIDDKVIVFTDDEVFAIYDTGPDNTGANGEFIVDRLQTSFGCQNARSLAEIPEGLCFYSKRSEEFHLISRDLQIIDIGKPIQDASSHLSATAGDAFHGTMVVPDQHEIRWFAGWNTTSEFGPAADTGTGIPDRPARPRFEHSVATNGAALAYNYHYKKWSIQEPVTGSAMWSMHEGRPNAVTATFRHFKEVKDNWTWSKTMMVETPWVRVANLQTYGRFEELLILGKYYSSWNDNDYDPRGFTGTLEAGDVQVELWYDYESSATASDTYLFRANRGDLGSENNSDRMQLAITPGKPKCQAVKVRVTEVETQKVEVSEPNYDIGRGFSLTGMDIVYTPKAGTGSKTLSKGRRK